MNATSITGSAPAIPFPILTHDAEEPVGPDALGFGSPAGALGTRPLLPLTALEVDFHLHRECLESVGLPFADPGLAAMTQEDQASAMKAMVLQSAQLRADAASRRFALSRGMGMAQAALDANAPNSPTALLYAAHVCLGIGRPTHAITAIGRLCTCYPAAFDVDTIAILVEALIQARDFTGAVLECEKAFRTLPNARETLGDLRVIARVLRGDRLAEIQEDLQALIDSWEDLGEGLGLHLEAWVALRSGCGHGHELAREAQTGASWIWQSALHAASGRHDEAFALLNAGAQTLDFPWLLHTPLFDSLRADAVKWNHTLFRMSLLPQQTEALQLRWALPPLAPDMGG